MTPAVATQLGQGQVEALPQMFVFGPLGRSAVTRFRLAAQQSVVDGDPAGGGDAHSGPGCADPEQPGVQSRLVPEARQIHPGFDQCVLDRVLGALVVSVEHPQRVPVHARTVSANDVRERATVTESRPGGQHLVGGRLGLTRHVRFVDVEVIQHGIQGGQCG